MDVGLTSEVDVIFMLQLPVNLLRAGRVFVFEPPPGVRANLLRTFSTLPPSRMSRVSSFLMTRCCVAVTRVNQCVFD